MRLGCPIVCHPERWSKRCRARVLLLLLAVLHVRCRLSARQRRSSSRPARAQRSAAERTENIYWVLYIGECWGCGPARRRDSCFVYRRGRSKKSSLPYSCNGEYEYIMLCYVSDEVSVPCSSHSVWLGLACGAICSNKLGTRNARVETTTVGLRTHQAGSGTQLRTHPLRTLPLHAHAELT